MKTTTKKKAFTFIAIFFFCMMAVAFALMVSGCRPEGPPTKSTRDKAVDSCVALGGVPIIDGWGDVTNCQFPPVKP